MKYSYIYPVYLNQGGCSQVKVGNDKNQHSLPHPKKERKEMERESERERDRSGYQLPCKPL